MSVIVNEVAKKEHPSTVMANIRRSIREQNKKDVAEGIETEILSKEELEIAVRSEYATRKGKPVTKKAIEDKMDLNAVARRAVAERKVEKGIGPEKKANGGRQTIYSYWIHKKELTDPKYFDGVGVLYAERQKLASIEYAKNPSSFPSIEEVNSDTEYQEYRRKKGKKEPKGEITPLLTKYTDVISRKVEDPNKLLASLHPVKTTSLRDKIYN